MSPVTSKFQDRLQDRVLTFLLITQEYSKVILATFSPYISLLNALNIECTGCMHLDPAVLPPPEVPNNGYFHQERGSFCPAVLKDWTFYRHSLEKQMKIYEDRNCIWESKSSVTWIF